MSSLTWDVRTAQSRRRVHSSNIVWRACSGGTGMLTIASEVLGAARTIAVDIDESAIGQARNNLRSYDLEEGDVGVEFLHCNIAAGEATGSYLRVPLR